MNPNSTPSEGLDGPVAASGGESKDGCVGAANGPQATVQDSDPRAVILDAISTALNAAGYWLPIDGKRAVADAVLAARDSELERVTKRLNRWREMYEEVEAGDQRVRDLHKPARDWSWRTFGCGHNGAHERICGHCRACYPCPTIATLDGQPTA